MLLPEVDPKTGSMLKKPTAKLRHDGQWREDRWGRIEWWDDDSPPYMRFVGSWRAPKLADPIGFSISHGVFYYEDIEGDIRRVHWYNKHSGFEWLIAPHKPPPETVLLQSLTWEDWHCLRGMQWENARDVLKIIYRKAKDQ